MSQSVLTRKKRVQFVKGEVTSGTPAAGFVACGDGTAFPLLVTVDQLAEIMYRVRDAWFTGGKIVYTGVDYNADDIFFVGTPNAAQLCSMDTDAEDNYTVSRRAYGIFKNPVLNHPAHFGEEYVLPSSGPTSDNCHDAESELALWVQEEWNQLPNCLPYLLNVGTNFPFRTGFSHLLSNGMRGTGIYTITGQQREDGEEDLEYGSGQLYLDFTGKIAWAGGVSPFDPAAALYVEMVFFAESLSPGVNIGSSVSSLISIDAGNNAANLVFALADSTVSCPLYTQDDRTGEDFVITAKKWWGYGGKFDTTTGARL